MYYSILFVLSFLCGSGLAHAQSIKELYYDLPSKMMGQLASPDETENKTKAFRKSVIKTVDLKNGYLETKGNVQFAKFSRKDMSPLLIVAGGSYAEDGRPVRIQTFAKDKDKGWEDVSRWYTPEIPMLVVDGFDKAKCKAKWPLSDSASGTYRYLLPRKGRVIKAVVDSDRGPACKAELFTLSFDGKRFQFGY